MSKLTKFLMRIPVPWIFVSGYLIGVPFQLLFQLKFKSPVIVKIYLVAGIIMFLFAVIIASWCLLIFRKAHNTTTPGIRSARLITNGPYRISRNPMYISLIFAYIGEAAILNQLCPLIVLPAVIYYVNNIIIPVEEELLAGEFDGEYQNYQRQVPKWL